jgi:hypothetical protein
MCIQKVCRICMCSSLKYFAKVFIAIKSHLDKNAQQGLTAVLSIYFPFYIWFSLSTLYLGDDHLILGVGDLIIIFYLGGGLTSLACVHTYTWNATRSMCCLNAASDGGSLTRQESFDKANFTLSLFRSLWTDLALPFGSYRSAPLLGATQRHPFLILARRQFIKFLSKIQQNTKLWQI